MDKTCSVHGETRDAYKSQKIKQEAHLEDQGIDLTKMGIKLASGKQSAKIMYH
jgi:hypothetical protein